MKTALLIGLLCLVPLVMGLAGAGAGLAIGFATVKLRKPAVVIRYVSPEEARALRAAGQQVSPPPTAK